MNTYEAIEVRVARAAEIKQSEASNAKPPRQSPRRLANQLTVTLRKPGAYLYVAGGRWYVYEGPRRIYGGTSLFDRAVKLLARNLRSAAPGKLTLR